MCLFNINLDGTILVVEIKRNITTQFGLPELPPRVERIGIEQSPVEGFVLRYVAREDDGGMLGGLWPISAVTASRLVMEGIERVKGK
jgi:hypothetical protein